MHPCRERLRDQAIAQLANQLKALGEEHKLSSDQLVELTLSFQTRYRPQFSALAFKLWIVGRFLWPCDATQASTAHNQQARQGHHRR